MVTPSPLVSRWALHSVSLPPPQAMDRQSWCWPSMTMRLAGASTPRQLPSEDFPMALIFCDSFDHYDDPALKWTAPNGATIDLTNTQGRTGIGALSPSSAGPGCQKAIPVGFGFVCGLGYKTNGGGNSIFGFWSATAGHPH